VGATGLTRNGISAIIFFNNMKHFKIIFPFFFQIMKGTCMYKPNCHREKKPLFLGSLPWQLKFFVFSPFYCYCNMAAADNFFAKLKAFS
jgi:hypothetical protein